MATLTVNVLMLPNVYTNVGLTVNAWLASDFVRNPSGQMLPTSGSPAATAVTNSSGVAALAGLTEGTAYWIQVIDIMGYFRWFLANWEANPLFANVNMPLDNLVWPL
jgi:hypothetical protein